ncbi:MAG: response regulator [Clostridia bacterium]|nr:response regulator [Clostridia bacterium]
MSSIKLLIADTSLSFTHNLIAYLRSMPDIEVIGACSSGIDLIKMVRTCKPDIVLMDAILEELDGLTALKRLTGEHCHAVFIVCTEFCTECVISRAFRSGAAAFVCKPADRAALYDTIIETAATAGRAESPDLAASLVNMRITENLNSCGIPSNCDGFRLLHHAIKYAMQCDESQLSMTKQLYPELGRIFGITSQCAERNIRSAILRAYSRGHMSSFAKRPTNRELIFSIANFVAASMSII